MPSNWFFNSLDKLRKKPAHVKSIIALGISGGITLVIGFFWLISYSNYIATISERDTVSLLSPFKRFGEFVGSRYSNMATTKVFDADKSYLESLGNVASSSMFNNTVSNDQAEQASDSLNASRAQIPQQNTRKEASTSTKKLVQ